MNSARAPEAGADEDEATADFPFWARHLPPQHSPNIATPTKQISLDRICDSCFDVKCPEVVPKDDVIISERCWSRRDLAAQRQGYTVEGAKQKGVRASNALVGNSRNELVSLLVLGCEHLGCDHAVGGGCLWVWLHLRV